MTISPAWPPPAVSPEYRPERFTQGILPRMREEGKQLFLNSRRLSQGELRPFSIPEGRCLLKLTPEEWLQRRRGHCRRYPQAGRWLLARPGR